MSIEDLNTQIKQCRKCRLWKDGKNAVPGEGPAYTTLMLVGQNPGAEEDKAGRPFVGRAGKFLNKVLSENGIDRNEIFVTNIVKHVSPKNRKPCSDEIASCVRYLASQINLVKPKIIVLLGATAKETPRSQDIEYMNIIHPSAAMRFGKMRAKFQEQIAELAERMKTISV